MSICYRLGETRYPNVLQTCDFFFTRHVGSEIVPIHSPLSLDQTTVPIPGLKRLMQLTKTIQVADGRGKPTKQAVKLRYRSSTSLSSRISHVISFLTFISAESCLEWIIQQHGAGPSQRSEFNLLSLSTGQGWCYEDGHWTSSS
ncbi:hypothetical protein KEM48_006196 [Puccinia striiformis f. sp. tritici PST-130]|nr:hypothetical protein KEM48_006196 [Puccinia striiformis f. sp. tritici PST-130]